MRPPHSSHLRALLGLVWLLASAGPALAQNSNEVEVRAEQFGIADSVRAGSWFGLRLALVDSSDRVRDAIVRLHMPDADGDTALVQRAVTLNPGAAVGVWLYGRLPSGRDSTSDAYTITVHAPGPSEDPDAPVVGRQLAAARVVPVPTGILAEADGLIAIVGRSTMGLEQYGVEARTGLPGTTHELVRTVANLSPQSLPDAWMGLAVLDALVWVDGAPADLREGQVEALTEWIYRGGRLIVVVPPVGETWSNPRVNPLFDLLPEVRFERREQVDLAPLRPLLTLSERTPLPNREVLHALPPVTGARDTFPVLALRDGAPIVVRRPHGAGDVTLIGLDLASPALAGRIDAQAFWRRVLGRRGDLFSQSEMQQLTSTMDPRPDFFARSTVWIDSDIGDLINQTGRASVGVLMGLILFASYLAIAGPISFAILGRMNKRQHSWLVFVATAAVFTGIAWGGASATRPARVGVTHLSILSHVYGQPVQRCRTWFGALLPTYGEQTVAIEREPGSPWRNTLTSWDRERLAATSSFPDPRDYVVDARRPDRLTVPTRSTVKEFQADWLGGPRWMLPRPVDENGVRVDDDGRLRGSLVHDLPGALEHVTIVFNRRQRPLEKPALGGPPFFDAYAMIVTSAPRWEPGAPLSLSETFRLPGPAAPHFARLTRSEQAFGLGGATQNRASVPERLEMLLWGAVLEPPRWQAGGEGTRTLIQRRAERFDLARWFTQPCVIVIGHMVDGPCPTPITVDGREPPARGRTLVCWVYPLPADPPAFPAAN